MSTTLLQANDFQFKAINGAVSIDEAKGIVECFVAAFGNKDSVGDVIVSGAFDESLKRRKPRVVWGHDWNQPIGKVLEIYEVQPNDPRLPIKMKRAGVGGLYARVQFNLKSERGREAFANVAFFGEEQEWSIGYKTLDAVYDGPRKANILKSVELYEVSPVLHGANQLTGTISVKSDKANDRLDSLQKSKWKMFDRSFAEMIKNEHPEIWAAGGNIKGNDQYEILTKIAKQGGSAKTEDQIKAIELREAWVARHKENFQLAGVIAQIKWLAVGTRGEDFMKNVVRKAIDKKVKKKGDWQGEQGGPGIPAEMPSMYAKRVAMALAMNFGGAVRLRELEKNIIVFDVMRNNEVETLRLSYHFDGTQFMFGDPEEVKPTMVYLPSEDDEDDEGEEEENEKGAAGPCWPGYEMVGMKPGKGGRMVPNCVPVKGMDAEDEDDDIDPFGTEFIKAPIPPDAIPQERITGDVLRGYGPRRGNLERLLRYWRPIMKKPGGFRRCLVILADHPELYPLQNICAWLHHETTGLWPNEGCHHPGMKNCRRKLRNMSDADFNSRLSNLARRAGKGMMPMDDEEYGDVTDDDIKMANSVLQQFANEEKEFMGWLADEKNWMHVGDDDDEMEVEHGWVKPEGMRQAGGCGCGCGGKEDDVEIIEKAGRMVSSANMAKVQQAITLLQQVVGMSNDKPVEVKKKSLDFVTLDEFIEPVLKYHNLDVDYTENGIKIKNLRDVTPEGMSALNTAVQMYRKS